MAPQDDDNFPGTDQTWAEIRAHQEGPVEVAQMWAHLIFAADGPAPAVYALAWPLTDPDTRLARVQAWMLETLAEPVDDRELVAHELTHPGCIEHPLWTAFASAEVAGYRMAHGHRHPERMGFLTRPRPIAIDYEVVLLAPGDEQTVIKSGTPLPEGTVPFLMHFTEGRWHVAHAFGDSPVTPGWPPTFPPITGFTMSGGLATSDAEGRLRALGLELVEADFGAHDDPDVKACVVVWPGPTSSRVALRIRPGLDADTRARVAEWFEQRLGRFFEHGPEPDGWQRRESDHGWQLWAREELLPKLG